MRPRIVIAPDKFKGSLGAVEAARAISVGVLRAAPDAEVDLVPMADGGEGTVEALIAATGGSWHEATVTGPLGEPVRARYGITGDGRTALMEMAAASGYVLVPQERKDPLRTTTRGTGELLMAAMDRGVERVVVGIGGSATNDGGAGFAQAVGYRLVDRDGEEIGPGGGALAGLAAIDGAGRDGRLDRVSIDVACDVDNPLCGPRGASAVYGPQKGATPEMVEVLDANLRHLEDVLRRDLGADVGDVPGAGAAGGLGAGLMAFAGGRLRRGVDIVLEAARLDERLRGADLCLTGEGSIDGSTAFGKTVAGVGRTARAAGCPAIALAGQVGAGFEAVLELGVSAVFSICSGPLTLDDAMKRAPELLENAAEQATRAFLAGRRAAGRSDRGR